MKQADQLVHAGDPDREGQLLVDEVINFLGVSKTKQAQVQRCLISDLNPGAVKKALGQFAPKPRIYSAFGIRFGARARGLAVRDEFNARLHLTRARSRLSRSVVCRASANARARAGCAP